MKMLNCLLLTLMDGKPKRVKDLMSYLRRQVDPSLAVRVYLKRKTEPDRRIKVPLLERLEKVPTLEIQQDTGTRRVIVRQISNARVGGLISCDRSKGSRIEEWTITLTDKGRQVILSTHREGIWEELRHAINMGWVTLNLDSN